MYRMCCSMLVVMLMSLGTVTAQTATPPAAGDGTSGAPYQIATLENLYWLSVSDSVWDAYFVQTADINAAATVAWDSDSGFTPIGNTGTAFTGAYDGGGYEIDSLAIDRATDNIGLFGYVNGATVTRVGLTDASVSGATYVGALAGYFSGSADMTYCHSSGTVTGTVGAIGGVVGYNLGSSTISLCHSSCDVNGGNTSAGFVGSNEADVSDCYCTGGVDGANIIGGFVGYTQGTISRCYSTGSVTSTGTEGGFAAMSNSGTENDCFWDITTSGESFSIYATGKATADMKDVATFTDEGTSGLTNAWDFVGTLNDDAASNDYWNIDTTYNSGYPYLAWEVVTAPVVTTDAVSGITDSSAVCGGNVTSDGGAAVTARGVCWNMSGTPTTSDNVTTDSSGTGTFTSALTGLAANTVYYVRAYATNSEGTSYGSEVSFQTMPAQSAPAGAGTEGDPYQIASLDNLSWLMQHSGEWDKYYLQTADINAAVTAGWDLDSGFTPLGNTSVPFAGTYDGGGYEIDSLIIDRKTRYSGVFGYANGADIKNLSVTDAYIAGDLYVGGLAGYLTNASLVTGCFVNGGTVRAFGAVSGGLAGYNNSSSVISRSYSSCTVNGYNTCGGFVGTNYATISDCYAVGAVTGNVTVAGFAAFTNGTVSRCYSTGSVTATGADGGFACYGPATNGSGTVDDCFWDKTTSGLTSSDGGTGKTTAQMQAVGTFTDTDSTGLSAAWDFVGNPYDDAGLNSYWNISAMANGGYPYFAWTDGSDQTVPVITSPTADTATEEQLFVYVGTATDDDSQPVITFSGLPAWLSASNDTVSGIPDDGDGDTAFTVIATDGGLADTQEVVVTVQPVNDMPLTGGGNALDFDGIDDYVRIPHDASFNTGGNITVECWGKFAEITNGRTNLFIDKYPPGSSNRGWVMYVDMNGCIGFGGRDGSGSWRDAGAGAAVDDDTWHHVAATKNGGVWSVYVDGVLSSSNDFGYTGSLDYAIDLHIGGQRDASWPVTDYHTDAVLDEIRIWNTARTEAEIRASMYLAAQGNETGLVACYHADGTVGTMLADASANGNDGILYPDAPAVWTGSAALNAVTVNEDDSVAVSTGYDVESGALTAVSVNGPANGSVAFSTGRALYRPDADFNGADTFSYYVSDGALADTAVVAVSVSAVNDAPVLTSAAVDTATEEQEYQYSATVSDPDDTPTIDFGPLPGWLTQYGDTLRGTPDDGDIDTVFMVYADDGEAVDSMEVSLTVIAVNDAPVLTSAAADTATEEQAYQYIATAADPDDTPTIGYGPLPGWLTQYGDTLKGTPDDPVSDTVFWVFADDGEYVDSQAVAVTVIAVNDAPVLTCAAVDTATEEQAYQYIAAAADPDGMPVISFASVPAWLTQNGDTLAGTPDDGDAGGTFRVYADDGESIDSMDVVLTLVDVNDAPVLTSASKDTATEEQMFSYIATATDADDVPVISFGTLPAWLAQNGDTITGTPDDGDKNAKVMVYATDGELTDSMEITIVMVEVNDPPVLTSAAADTATEETQFTYTPTADDPDDGSLDYSYGPLPGWLGESGITVRGTPDDGDADTVFWVYASDGEYVDSLLVSVAVLPVNDPPVLTSGTVDTATEEQLFTYVGTASDVDGTPVISYGPLPGWLVQHGDSVYGTPDDPVADTLFWVFADDGEAVDSQAVTVAVVPVNDPPVITSAPVTDAEANRPYRATTTVTDADGDAARTTFSLAVAPAGMAVDDSTGEITWLPAASQAGDTVVSLVVNDGDGAADTLTYTLTVAPATFAWETVNDTGVYLFDAIGVALHFISLTGADTVTAEVFADSFPPNLPGNNPVKRLYDINAGSGITAFEAVLTFTYSQADFDASDIADETTLYAARWSGTEWVPFGSIVDTAANTVTVTTTEFSLWALGGEGAAVPVELSSFTAAAVAGGVQLAWTTASERDNYGFNVLRSDAADGPFEQVNAVMLNGAGTTSLPQSYTFTDADAGAGTWYYRLEMVGVDGTREYSDVIAVSMQASGISMPVSISPAAARSLVLYNLNGSVVRGATVSAGVYLYRSNGDLMKVIVK